MTRRIALIHAVTVAMQPIEEAFQRLGGKIVGSAGCYAVREGAEDGNCGTPGTFTRSLGSEDEAVT